MRGRAGLAVAFVGSGRSVVDEVKGSAVRQGSEGREDTEVAGVSAEESEEEVEAEE